MSFMGAECESSVGSVWGRFNPRACYAQHATVRGAAGSLWQLEQVACRVQGLFGMHYLQCAIFNIA